MKLEAGQFVRTSYGIRKCEIVDDDGTYKFNDEIYNKYGDAFVWLDEDELEKYISKASYNIIDLIKHKDIILGKDGKIYQCWKVYKDYVFTYSKNKQGQTITLVDYQIDKVLTKEQFEQMAYKVGE